MQLCKEAPILKKCESDIIGLYQILNISEIKSDFQINTCNFYFIQIDQNLSENCRNLTKTNKSFKIRVSSKYP